MKIQFDGREIKMPKSECGLARKIADPLFEEVEKFAQDMERPTLFLTFLLFVYNKAGKLLESFGVPYIVDAYEAAANADAENEAKNK